MFFDVEVPAALRQTMGWTAKMMQQNDQTLDQAIVQLRRLMTELEGKRRVDAETALRLVELRARPALPRGNPYGMGDRIAANAVHTGTAAADPNAQNVSSTNVPQGPAPAAAQASQADHCLLYTSDAADE